MSDSNKTITFVGSIIAGVMGIIIVIYTMVYSPLNAALANERDSRSECMAKLQNDFFESVKIQNRTNQEILISLTTLKTDVEYIKKAVK